MVERGGPVQLSLDASGLTDGLAEAGADMDRIIRSDILPSIEVMDEAVKTVAKNMEQALNRAAKGGKVTMKDLAQSIAKDLSDIAIDRAIRQPIENGLGRIFSGLPFGGGRAAGGGVHPGAAYLVGERGPELFTPGASGRISSATAGGVTVNMAFPQGTDVESFRRSEAQLSAMIARASARGGRNM